jgi:hypothetical protein
MKIIAKYLVMIDFKIVEVVELENGSLYQIWYINGVPTYDEMDKDTFYEYRDYSKDRL